MIRLMIKKIIGFGFLGRIADQKFTNYWWIFESDIY